jgi:hypothetical protein
MKVIRHIGSMAFVFGLFTAVFAGIPWYVMVADDPVLPGWLRIAVFCLLGGILVVLATLALEQRVLRASVEMGADAVINVRYMTTSVVGTAAELLVYGTAVKLS